MVDGASSILPFAFVDAAGRFHLDDLLGAIRKNCYAIDIAADEAVLRGLQDIRYGLNLAVILVLIVVQQHGFHDTPPLAKTIVLIRLLVDTGLGCPEAQSGFVRVKV